MRKMLFFRWSICLLLLVLCLPVSASAADTIIEWDGGCYDSQVYGLGTMTLVKTPNDENSYDVTLIGFFSIYSPTYGYVRQELPPGFLPDTINRYTYQCQEAINNGEQRFVSVAQGEDDIDLRYENGSIWFPEKFYNGRYDLTCRWKTNQPDPPDKWASCTSVIVKSLMAEPTPTPTFVPTAPAPEATATPVPSTPTPIPTPRPIQVFIPQAHASLCLPGSCN